MNFKAIKTTGLSFAIAAAFLVDRDRDGRVDTRGELIQERRCFNDGLAKGRADAIAHRRFSPFPYRRFVSNDYRQGFHRGYAQAYRQFAFNRGHRYGRY